MQPECATCLHVRDPQNCEIAILLSSTDLPVLHSHRPWVVGVFRPSICRRKAAASQATIAGRFATLLDTDLDEHPWPLPLGSPVIVARSHRADTVADRVPSSVYAAGISFVVLLTTDVNFVS